MKKGLLLAMGAVSFGIAGLASFTPMVSAADSGDVKVTATVSENLAVSAQPATIALGVNDLKTSTDGTVTMTSNSGQHALTVKASTSADLTHTDGTTTIPASATLTSGTAGWGVKAKAADADYQAVSVDAPVALGSYDGGTMTPVYGVATAANQKSGAYSTDVIYTYGG